MKYLYTIILIIFCLKANCQNKDSISSFGLEFYLDDKRINIEELNLQLLQSSTNNNGYSEFNSDNYELENQNTDSLPRRTNLIYKITSDSVFMYKGTGTFQMIINYKGVYDTISQGFSYFEYGGRVVIGIINNVKEFRKNNYKKFKLLTLFKDDKEVLEDKYPYLTVSEYCPPRNSNTILYVATKMNTSYGAGYWWGTFITAFGKIEE